MIALIVAILSLTVCIHYIPKVLVKSGVSAMEFAEVSLTIAWLLTTFIILCYTWKAKDVINTDDTASKFTNTQTAPDL